jgi:hypothetical protein
MKHLLHITPAGLQVLWKPGTPWKTRRRLAVAFLAFAEGIDPHDHAPGFYRFDVDDDGNAMIGGRAEHRCYRCERLIDPGDPWDEDTNTISDGLGNVVMTFRNYSHVFCPPPVDGGKIVT